MSEIRKTALNALHHELGARMVAFAGYEMPIQYEGIVPEHLWVRKSAGLFDVSHMGEIDLNGPGALEMLMRITTNNPSNLAIGQVQYSAFGTEQGGALDDLLIYRMAENHFFLVVNAANDDKDWAWVSGQAKNFDVEAAHLSLDYTEIAFQGPLAQLVLQSLTDYDLEKMGYYWFDSIDLMGKKDVLVSRTGYTGEDGFEIYTTDPQYGMDLARKLLSDQRVKPIGLGARDTLRMEMGYCLYGNDMDENQNLLEAGLGWIIDFGKPDFIGKSALAASKEKGLKYRRVGFIMKEQGGLPRHGQKAFVGGSEAGWVSSGTLAPSIGKGAGLAYLPRDFKVGEEFEIEVRPGKLLKAERVNLPMVKGTVRK